LLINFVLLLYILYAETDTPAQCYCTSIIVRSVVGLSDLHC